MKKNYTHVGVLLDASTSMSKIKSEVIIGFNNLLEEQKKVDGEMILTLSQFSSSGTQKTIFDSNIKDAVELTDKSYVTDGMTALLDSAHSFIVELGLKFAKMKEEDRPEKVLFVMITDGEENNSKEIRHNQLAELIKEQETKYNWQFAYIGANQDAFAVGASLGITSAVNYNATHDGTNKMFRGMSSSLTSYRSKVAQDGEVINFTLSQNDIDNA